MTVQPRSLPILTALVCTLFAFAADAQTFTAQLGWVPIGGAERNDVGGEGTVTARLSGSRLSIDGSFEGLPANTTSAKLHQGVATGARGRGIVVGDLTITSSTSGTLTGQLSLTPEHVAALNAGQLYIQVYSEKGVLPDHDTLFGWLLR